MKAWICDTNNSEGSVIVFADTRGKAKVEAQSTDCIDYAPFTEIHAKRCPEIDDMEDHEPTDNYWLNDEIRLILVQRYDWACTEPQYSDCDSCIAKQYCHWHE